MITTWMDAHTELLGDGGKDREPFALCLLHTLSPAPALYTHYFQSSEPY